MTARFDRRQFLVTSSAALASSLLLKACANTPTTSTTSPPPESAANPAAQDFKVAIVLPGVITDKAWNQVGYEGLNEIKKTPGIETAYVEKIGQPEQAEALSDFARRGFNLVYAHGGQFDAAIQQVASQFPKTFFIGVNGAASGSNIAALRIDHLQASYLCGMIAASTTKSKKIAYIAGQEFQATQEELRGLQLGVKSVDPTVQISSTFTGDWNDAAKAKEAAEALISSGADVIYQWLDNAASTVLQTASDKGVYAFGNTADQLDVAPKAVLTSAVKRIDLAIAKLADLRSPTNSKDKSTHWDWKSPKSSTSANTISPFLQHSKSKSRKPKMPSYPGNSPLNPAQMTAKKPAVPKEQRRELEILNWRLKIYNRVPTFSPLHQSNFGSPSEQEFQKAVLRVANK